MQKIANAAKLINEALPAVPPGSEMYDDLLKVATGLNKLLQKVPQNPGQQATGLVQQARQIAQQGPAQQALAQMFPQQGGQPPQQPPAGPAQ